MKRYIAGWMLCLGLVALAQSQEGPRVPVPTGAQLQLPGATWESIAALPALTGSRWVPVDVDPDEKAYLQHLQLPPLKSPYRAQAAAAIKAVMSGKAAAPSTSCALEGMPRLAWYPYPLQFVYGAANVMLLEHDIIRATTTLGLDRTPQDQNSLQGYVIHGDPLGAWQGDTLVIDTVHVREDKDTFYGIPNDPDLHVIERYRLAAPDRLEKLVTIEAPSYFTAPWQIRTVYRREAEGSWATHFCLPTGAVAPRVVVEIPAERRSPAPANARFTPNITWPQILALPKLWGVGWRSGGDYDDQVTNFDRITLWPPLLPRYLEQAQTYIERQKQGRAEFKFGGCYPNGVPRESWFAYTPIFLMRPGNSLLIDVGGETREVFMDGRPHPATLDGSDLSIAYLGHSIGWWEQDTLVIDSVGFAPEDELFYGVRNGGAMHVVERYRLLDPGTLEEMLTVEDPDRLALPWTLVRQYPGSPTSQGMMSAGPGGSRIETWPCRPGDAREVVDPEGNSFVNLKPPPKGRGLTK